MPPLPAKDTLDGQLFLYGDRSRPAFRAGSEWRRCCVVHVVGLTEGLLSSPWGSLLAQRAEAAGWGYVQPLLHSSYLGYGVSSLDRDAAELEALLVTLRAKGVEGVVVVGHSTGAQDAVRLVQTRAAAEAEASVALLGVALVSGVSDREYWEGVTAPGEAAALLATAAELRAAGRGGELMPRAADTAPISADRFHALCAAGGDDDVFSADLEEEAVRGVLAGFAALRGVLVVHAGCDEYVPGGRAAVAALQERLRRCLPEKARFVVVEDKHEVEKEECQVAVVDAVIALLSECE